MMQPQYKLLRLTDYYGNLFKNTIMKIRNVIFAVLAVVTMSSCKSQYELLLNSNDVDAKYKAAFEYFNKGKFNRAASMFESLAMLTDGTEKDDTVRYYWGLSNYKYKDYYTAETNFENFVTSYPRSPFAEDARFLRIDCMYRSTYRYELDQTPSYKAITNISEYLMEYPDTEHEKVCRDMLADLNERLDRKAYEGARLYYRMEDYLASRIALRNVLKDDSDNIYREDILYYIAMSSYKYAKLSVPAKQRERYLVFVDDYLNFIGEIPESQYRKELDNVYAKVMVALGRGAEVDEKTTEKDFARERAKFQREAKRIEKAEAKAAKSAEKAAAKSKKKAEKEIAKAAK